MYRLDSNRMVVQESLAAGVTYVTHGLYIFKANGIHIQLKQLPRVFVYILIYFGTDEVRKQDFNT